MTAALGSPGGRARPPEELASLGHLLDRNRAWAARKTGADPRFFQRLADQQSPDYFWIGCSDSRVPATEIVDLDPGEMFVHRNVANLARAHDLNYAAALHFAVDVLQVRHIIVVGHYGCGGVGAAMTEAGNNALDRWLGPVRELYREHEAVLAKLSAEARHDRLCELNVRRQVGRVAGHPAVVEAWRAARELTVHGWIYAVETGLITNLGPSICGLEDSALGIVAGPKPFRYPAGRGSPDRP